MTSSTPDRQRVGTLGALLVALVLSTWLFRVMVDLVLALILDAAVGPGGRRYMSDIVSAVSSAGVALGLVVGVVAWYLLRQSARAHGRTCSGAGPLAVLFVVALQVPGFFLMGSIHDGPDTGAAMQTALAISVGAAALLGTWAWIASRTGEMPSQLMSLLLVVPTAIAAVVAGHVSYGESRVWIPVLLCLCAVGVVAISESRPSLRARTMTQDPSTLRAGQW